MATKPATKSSIDGWQTSEVPRLSVQKPASRSKRDQSLDDQTIATELTSRMRSGYDELDSGGKVDMKAKAKKPVAASSSALPEKQLMIMEPDGYDEDFEAYEEDFEDFGDNEEQVRAPGFLDKSIEPKGVGQFDELKRAMATENAKVGSNLKPDAVKSTQPQNIRTQAPTRTIVNLEISQRQALENKRTLMAQTKLHKRANDLKKLVEMDTSTTYDVFDLTPLNEYDLYIRNYGASNTGQMFTQTNEDRCEKEAQTDDWDVEDKWVQATPDAVRDVGAGQPLWIELQVDKKNAREELGKVDSQALSKFLKNCAPAIDALLDEAEEDAGLDGVFTGQNSMQFFLPFSKGFLELHRQSVLTGRTVRTICFSPVDRRSLLMGWSLPKETERKGRYGNKGLATLWHLGSPKCPYRMLMCDSEATCVAFDSRGSLAFAGLEDGSLVIWDLRDDGFHEKVPFGDSEVKVCWPQYSTAGLYTTKRAHETRIRSVICLDSKNAGGEDRSLQVLTVDENGIVQAWTVMEMLNGSLTEIEVDLGMALGSKIKAVRGTQIHAKHPDGKSCISDLTITDVAILPNSPDRLLLATDLGFVLQVSRYGESCHPQMFHLRGGHSASVTTLHISPFKSDAFLAGYSNGSVALYSLNDEVPGKVWGVSSHEIKCVRWASQRPGVFYVVDKESTLTIWDLTENDKAPAVTQPLKNYRSISMSENLGSVVVMANTQRATNLRGENPMMVFGFDNGMVEAHLLDEQWAEMGVGEEDVLNSYILS